MNFLQICQRAASECGVAGTLTTTAEQIGSPGRIVSWCSDAWNEIQTAREDWNWMRSSAILGRGVAFTPAPGQFNTPLGTGGGQLGIDPDTFGKWDESTFRTFTSVASGASAGTVAAGIGISAIGQMAIGIEAIAAAGAAASGTVGTSTGAIGIGAIGEMAIGVGPIFPTDEIPLPAIDFDTWRDGYMLGAMRNVQTRPTVISVGPDQSLNLGAPPNGKYTITGDYWLASSLMVNDTDTPVGLPARFHMLVVYKTLMKYGLHESAGEVIERAKYEWNLLYRKLEAQQLPRMGFAGALA